MIQTGFSGNISMYQKGIKKAAGLNDFIIRCEVGNVGVLLHYDTGIGDPALAQPSFEWPVQSGNHYLNSGSFQYVFTDYKGNLRQFPAGEQVYGENGIFDYDGFRVRSNIDNYDSQAISALDTEASYTDWQNYYNESFFTGINMIRKTHAWKEHYCDDFIVWEHKFKNISQQPIKDFYIFNWMDCDISSLGGGSGLSGYWKDDMAGFYSGTNDGMLDPGDNKVWITYMYDCDNPAVSGDDRGGWQTPKESPGFIGTITINCPAPEISGFEKNRPSGQSWWGLEESPPPAGLPDFIFSDQTSHYRVPPSKPGDYKYLVSWGPYDLEPGESVEVVHATGLGSGLEKMVRNLTWAKKLFQNDWKGPEPPPSPSLNAVMRNGYVGLTWGSGPEDYVDPVTGFAGFEGYKVWKSTDNVNWELLGQYDVMNGTGRNTGLVHSYKDYSVRQGFSYNYSVTSYDRGEKYLGLEALESLKQANKVLVQSGQPVRERLEKDGVFVVPNPYYGGAPWNYTPNKLCPSADRIGFYGLPSKATIRIYTLAGDHVKTIYHNNPNSGVEFWDTISKAGMDVMSGVYLYVVEDNRKNKVIGKFVIIQSK